MQKAQLDGRRHNRAVITVSMLFCCLTAQVFPAFAQAGQDSKLPLRNLAWNTDSTGPVCFVSAHGQHAAVFGYSDDGLEAWAYPFQILSSYKVRFHPLGTTSDIDGQRLLRRIVYAPDTVTRIYTGPDFVVSEKILVPIEESGAIISYNVASARPLDISIRFVPVLNLMWPGGIGGQSARWSSADSAYLLLEETHRFTASIGSPDIVSHDETPNAGRPHGPEPGLSFTIRAGADRSTARVIIAGGTPENERAVATRLQHDEGSLEKLAADRYSALLDHALQIETPDESTNRALAWSEIALEQAWVCNPDLGCGLVAGYGPSRMARRPQYDWFFAGDGMVDLPAMLASGQYERAREELEFILKYQDKKTGMIWHEISQSAGWIDWSKYPYMFVHVELTFDFLNAVESYYSTTGDREFVEKHWLEIQSAYGYCRSVVDPSDGLPRIPAGKEAAREQERLTEELALSASWFTAAQAFAHLAAATGHASIASEAYAVSRQAAKTIPTRYWDENQNFWITGYTITGTPLSDRQIGPVWILGQTLFSDAQRGSILQQLASSRYQTDWGTRGTPSNSSTYDPNSYANGSVWAVSTSAVATAFWSAHQPATAFPIWNALVPWSSLDSLGHMHETLAGDYYHEELESVPEQTWSSATFFTAAVNGMLGLQVNGISNQLTLAPHLPVKWTSIKLRRLRVGSSEIGLELFRSNKEMQLQLHNSGTPMKLIFNPEIPMGAELGIARLQGRPLAARVEKHPQDLHARVEFTVPRGDSLLTLGYAGGVLISPTLSPVMVGAPSNQTKITRVDLQGQHYTVGFDYEPSAGAEFELLTPWKIANVRSGRVETVSPGEYKLVIPPKKEDEKPSYQKSQTEITFASDGSR